MSLNTILSYVYWDQLEPSKGKWDSSGNNDIACYFKTAQEQGFNVVLPPGRYICAEHECGGFPAWLSEVPGMVIGANNKPFLDVVYSYIETSILASRSVRRIVYSSLPDNPISYPVR